MDKRMPVMDGVEAAKAIRALDRSDAKTIPILAMTGDVDDASIAECMAAGMNGHIGKPIQAAELFHTLVRILQDHP
jgi:CheY-like chemotaxis protein